MAEWPPRFARAWVDKAAESAIMMQRKVFFRMLTHQIPKVVVPLDGERLADSVTDSVKEATAKTAALLVQKHVDALPEGCPRAPGHLQMAALAIAAQRELLTEARRADAEYQATTKLRVRSSVADLLGVVAPPDGTPPVAVPAMYLPNRLAMGLTGALWLPSRKASMVRRMMENFENDLGEAFDLEPMPEEEAPAPSRRMRRCFYSELCRAEDEPLLAPLFTAQHGTAWAGVPGFEFVVDDEATGACSFIFR